MIGEFNLYGYIYKTTNMLNNKIYIGQHKGTIFDPYYYGSGSRFRTALKKYGKENFKCELLEKCDTPELLNEREVYWIEFYQATNPLIGYNLAKGGEQCTIGCTEQEIKIISKLLWDSTSENIYDTIMQLQKYGIRIYQKGEEWIPTSYNSNDVKMIANDSSIVVSFYTKNQHSITKEYATELNCSYWRYNLMVEINKIPNLMKKLRIDYNENKIIPENQGVGRGTAGIFLETHKHTKSARMPLDF